MRSQQTGRFSSKHGKRTSRVYKIWQSMRERCNSPRNASYPRYGGRGISVCERWHAFENFYADMGDPPAGYSLERIDVNGNYEPSNCKWIPLGEQALNRTSTRFLTAFGETKSIPMWLKDSRCKVGRPVLGKRLENGWDDERALSVPPFATRQGEGNHHSSLTNEQATQIRQRYAAGETNKTWLAKEYGVTPLVIRCIVIGKTYRVI